MEYYAPAQKNECVSVGSDMESSPKPEVKKKKSKVLISMYNTPTFV